MLQFSDDHGPGCFTCGIGFEATESDTEVAKLHFLVPAASVSDLATVVSLEKEKQVQPLREFRAWLREHAGKYWPDTGTYREELRQRLGVLPDSFHRLIAKALAFKPIGQVRQFVFDYLLDPRPIDTAALQANLEHYKRLEGEAKDAEKRIEELEEIVREGERIRTEQRTAESHRYMVLSADREGAQIKVESLENKLFQTRANLEGLKTRAGTVGDQLERLERERERVAGLLEGHEVYRHLRDLERQLEDTERRSREAEEADQQARKLLLVQMEALDALVSEGARALRRARSAMFENDDLVGAQQMPESITRLRATLAAEGALAGRDLVTWERRLDKATDRVRTARIVLQQEMGAAKAEGSALQEEQRTLEAGRQRYPDGPAALLHLLSTRLKGKREAKPLCELIEVPNARWRDAVEGYLNTRRFDVIVAPEDYPHALGLYERNKRDYVLPGRGNIFAGVGLVDIERVIRVAKCESRSLAEQVETTEAYCDFVLGDVICVDDEQSLRKHRAAITDTVMVYQSHVARQTRSEVFSRHYIGEAARRRRIEEIASRLGILHLQAVSVAGYLDWLNGAVSLLDRARTEARRLPDLVTRAEGLAGLKLQAKRLVEQKEKIDRSDIRELEHERDEVVKHRNALGVERDEIQRSIGDAERILNDSSDQLEVARKGFGRAQATLQEFADSLDSLVCESYEQRYVRERLERSPADIQDVFERQRRNIESRIVNLAHKVVLLETRYVERHGFMATVDGYNFEEFATELETWRESRLPAYREKISESKTKALQQLAEDIVFRLRENLLLVRRQIDDLNRALHDVPFGSDQYQFTIEIAPEHREFHNLVMDAGRYGKESLFGAAALATPELKEKLGELLDRLVDAEAKELKTELEAKADYREYFRYDLKILHADGGYSLYDKVSGDKSGGETQTPYYIAILASMYRLYRSRSLDGGPICGLVLLDEAFGKMDESRIAATLIFARKLGLQLVLATPRKS
jgi:uncharacterized protein YPO0396